ncbi:MAG: Do family serine endopeptidase [Bacteroidia bacterium]
MKILKQIFLLTVAALLGGFISVGIYRFLADDPMMVNSENAIPATPARYEVRNITVPTFDFADVSEKVTSTVVHIMTRSTATNYRHSNPFEFFGTPHHNMPSIGSGSGVIISEDGFIVTNNHVIDNADQIEVVLSDRRRFDAEVIGRDPSTDLALLKIKTTNLPAIDFGNSDKVRVGEWVLAVGNPFNLTSTVTAGIVSAKARNINLLGGQGIESFIQTDAAVNPGNSGGALVNTRGELVGINTAIASSTGQYTGYSFAVPVNIVSKVVKDISELGMVQRGYIGVSIRNVTAELARENDLQRVEGVFVADLAENGAAKDAGIRKGDVILKVNDFPINTVPELQETVGMYRPGDQVMVTLLRDGRQKELKVVLRNADGETAFLPNDTERLNAALGATFEDVSDKDKQRLSIRQGVKVSKLKKGGLIDLAGLVEGFVITRINKQEVAKTDEVERLIKASDGGVLIEGYYPNGARGVFGFTLDY